MQMILIERCTFYLPTANFYSHEGKSACQPQRLAHGLWKICRVQIFIRTKAKVHISPKGWRTVFGRFAECKFFIRTKAKVRVSPKGWRTVFGRFAECKDKHYSRNLQTFNSLLLSLFNK